MSAAPRPNPNPMGVNDNLLDAMIRHQVHLLRYSGELRNRYVRELNEVEVIMLALILKHFGRIDASYTAANRARVNSLIRELLEVRAGAWVKITKQWRVEMRDLIKKEDEFNRAVYQDSIPVEYDFVSGVGLGALMAGVLINGRNFTQRMRQLRTGDAGVVAASIRESAQQQESPRQAARRLVGTRSLKGRDGRTQLTRNHVATHTRSIVTALSSATRRNFGSNNREVIKLEMFSAVLDGRTTKICASNDQRVSPEGEGPQPPLHENCRSVLIPVIDPESIIFRPAVPVVNRAALRDFLRENNLPSNITSRARLPRGFKGKYDDYLRNRIRAVVGQADPLSVNYEQWLRRQPKTFQDDYLGKTKARLFRGGASLDTFVGVDGRELSLFEISKRDADAFRDAGLDPTDALWERYLRTP